VGGWLVTGAAGFAGRHLVDRLRERGERVVAAGHDAEVALDLRDPERVDALVERAQPEVVVHLAGTATRVAMARDPTGGNENIVLPAVHVLRSVQRSAPGARVVVGSCCHVYGRAARLPTDEAQPLRPADLYGAARSTVEYFAREAAAGGVAVVIARLFDFTGAGQGPDAELSAWAAAVRAGAGRVEVADPDRRRDLCDVRDMAAGLELLGRSGVPGEAYNLCSGESHPMARFFAELAPDVEAIVVGASPPRREVPEFRGDPGKAEALGWTRRHDWRDALRSLREG